MMLLILRYLDVVTDDTIFRKWLVFSTGIHFSSVPPISACQLIMEMPEQKKKKKSHTCMVGQLPDWAATVC